MTFPLSGPVVVIDLSNLCRDADLAEQGKGPANYDLLAEFEAALVGTEFDRYSTYCVADHSLARLVSSAGQRRLRHLEQIGSLEFSALADEQILDYALGRHGNPEALVASKDNFDDFRRVYPEIQGSTDRFLSWERRPSGQLAVVRRDMGDHDHQRLSLKEESEELKARRLRRDTVVRRARSNYFTCSAADCLIAQLWPKHLPELPRYDADTDQFVCPGCGGLLAVGEPRDRAVQLIVFVDGVEEFRILLEEAQEIRVGRHDALGCIGLQSRLPGTIADAVSRSHVAFSFDGRRVEVRDLGSRNGTVVRSKAGRESDQQLVGGEAQRVSRQHSVALPSGITIELSGRTIGLAGEQVPGGDHALDPDQDDRSTRLVTRR